MKIITVFCLPFVGGNKYSYRDFSVKAPSFLNIVPLEYPGRGARIKEPFITDIHNLTTDIYRQVAGHIDREAYAIYGHSMGGLMAWLLAGKIAANGHPLPLHLFITGASAPSSPSRGNRKTHLLGKKKLFDEMRKMKGIPDKMLEDEELMDYLEPSFRADLMATENYVYEEAAPLDIPFTVINGQKEDIRTEDTLLWQKESTCPVDFKRLPGGHFFIYDYSAEIISVISAKVFIHLNPV